MAGEVQPEVTEKLRKEITEGFDNLCRDFSEEEIQNLVKHGLLGISYDFGTDRLCLLDEDGIVIDMGSWVMSALAWAVRYVATKWPEPDEFTGALLGFMLLYVKVFHHIVRMAWLMRQDGKDTTEIVEFVQKALPELFPSTYMPNVFRLEN